MVFPNVWGRRADGVDGDDDDAKYADNDTD
ncbi:hypothetical protein J2753_001651 [Halolamina salifodinae]|uniref:Uncharacterized protein n=1 Tax=Halolamina salifodinae TaxID=1202767 RepID=A0A8T4GYD6_9EURY|nr:hypothetical protein [Halolamina salifodinae]